ncbi:radical SAM protein [Tepiditoga spiralis]|uniref:Radical SAM protein n=1 Tax=Tepiditoga spiralis TaxID=2108365 RepID=A0A7G1G850_9BACT|nr:radical SAM protein [Tepiditoga spiralis]BBE31394.1 radical SAM protein [Tepiditoga spiralis]
MKKIKLINLKKTKSISVTGEYCYLNCNHCNKHYLKDMKKINDIEDLIKNGYTSFLMSGGMNEEIKVPAYNFSKQLLKIKEKYGIKYNFHTGFIKEEEIEKIKNIADTISYDLVGNKQTMIDVYKINKFKEMWETFELLLKNNLKVKPHITIGLNGGKLTHENDALKKLKNYKDYIDEIIFIVFIPTKGSFFENNNPPELDKVIEIIKTTKKEFSNHTITLGCMQPKGSYRLNLQLKAIDYVDKLVQPVNSVIKECIKRNYDIEYGDECCAF